MYHAPPCPDQRRRYDISTQVDSLARSFTACDFQTRELEETMKTALYARVSTTQGQSPKMQLRELHDYCKRRGWKISGEYVDEGVSGAKASRPKLDRMMADAHKRRFDAVVVWKFDRFARSVSHLLRALETFNSLGIAFVSLSESIDTSTPAGKMVFTVLGAVAELERSLIGERVKAGLRNAKANGTRLGRKPKRTFSPSDVRQLRRDRRRGQSYSALAAKWQTSVWTAYYLCNRRPSREL
jgi:DNA invertase Pin-like site-specific DNA recombinase